MDIHEVGMSVVDLCLRCGFAKSKNQARNHISGGAIRVQNIKINDVNARVAADTGNNKIFIVDDNDILMTDMEEDDSFKFSMGKKNHMRILIR